MMNLSDKSVSESATPKNRYYAWRSLLFGFSIFPIVLLAGPLLATIPQEYDAHIYIGMLLGLLAIVFQIVGFVFGVIGLVKVRGPEKIFCSLGVLVCFLFCLMVIDKLIK